MNTVPYPIYVISLKRTPERRLHIKRQLDALGLNYRFVDAIDKHDLQSPEYRVEIARRLGVQESAVIHHRNSYFDDHFACSLSHVKAYNLIMEHGDEVACILEDDADISSDFPEILRAAQKMSWDILMLSSHSRTVRYIPATNSKIQKSVEEFPAIDSSLFPRLKKIGWLRRLLPPAAASPSQLDWTFIPKFEWFLMMLLSHSRVFNALFRYSINAYKCLLFLYNPKHHIIYKDGKEYRRLHAACKIGGLPVMSSQQTLYGNYNIATPVELPTSGMAYLLTSAMANKCKALVNTELVVVIDSIPWRLQKRDGIRLRIVTPPCVTAALIYLKDSVRGFGEYIDYRINIFERLCRGFGEYIKRNNV